jgi:predicted transcriptional regulator
MTTREPNQPTNATIVEGEYDPSVLAKVAYEIKLSRIGPGNVEFTLTLNGLVFGSMPFDNLVKAATRIDPDHAVGSELQIQKLRKETAEAKAAMYDWQAKAEQLEKKLHEADAKLVEAHKDYRDLQDRVALV